MVTLYIANQRATFMQNPFLNKHSLWQQHQITSTRTQSVLTFWVEFTILAYLSILIILSQRYFLLFKLPYIHTPHNQTVINLMIPEVKKIPMHLFVRLLVGFFSWSGWFVGHNFLKRAESYTNMFLSEHLFSLVPILSGGGEGDSVFNF